MGLITSEENVTFGELLRSVQDYETMATARVLLKRRKMIPSQQMQRTMLLGGGVGGQGFRLSKKLRRMSIKLKDYR